MAVIQHSLAWMYRSPVTLTVGMVNSVQEKKKAALFTETAHT